MKSWGTLLTAMKVAEGGLSGTAEKLLECFEHC